jgi:hypothetical protein
MPVVSVRSELLSKVSPTPRGEADPVPPAAQATPRASGVGYQLVALAAVIAAGVVVGMATEDSKYSAAAVAATGVSVFAGIYAAAQGIERLLEPISSWLLSDSNDSTSYEDAVKAADSKVSDWFTAPADEAKKTAAESAMGTMAKAKQQLDKRRKEREAVFWAVASIAGMLASGFFHLYLLKLIGVETSRAWDVFATGVIVGAGTKPLHDLIERVSSSPSADSTTSEAGSTTTTTTQSWDRTPSCRD